MRTTAIIVAAGRGTRAGGDLPKQWQMLHGAPVLAHTIRAFEPHVDDILLVVHSDDMHRAADLGQRAVVGGATRDASVRAGLAALANDPPDYVLIHDAARPLVSADLITRVIAALGHHSGAAPAVAVTDALWTGHDDLVTGTHDRRGLYRAQTPQGFHFDAIHSAHGVFEGQAADDVEVARAAGIDVAIVAGDDDNLKITQPADFARADKLMGQGMDIRTGNGFDVHRFGDGDQVMLCGVAIPHSRGLQGHSDADVGLHTITDAIYGALARGDIGQHFPPSDPQWKGCESHVFLRHAAGLARDMGFTITHIDCTLICEFPKIGPHAGAMRAMVADITGLDVDRVSVKATTSERLGFTGRGEGIAAMATTTLVKT